MGLIVKNLSIRGNVVVGNTPSQPSGGVTPSPTPNWGNLIFDGTTGIYDYRSQQIQGISTTITLSLQYDDNTYGVIYYYISPTDDIGSVVDSAPPTGQPSLTFIRILNNETLTVSNNEYIIFGFESNQAINGSTSVNVRNNSDGNVVLDTFNIVNQNIT